MIFRFFRCFECKLITAVSLEQLENAADYFSCPDCCAALEQEDVIEDIDIFLSPIPLTVDGGTN